MRLHDLFALSIWPLIGLGCWLAHKAKVFAAGDVREKVLVGIAAGLMLGPLLAILVLFRHYSASVMAAEYSLIAGLGTLILFSVWPFDLSSYRSIIPVGIGVVMFGWGSGIWVAISC